MEGRRIPGSGLEHEQEYIAERLEQAGDVDEYAAAAQRLKQEATALEQLLKHQEQRSSDQQ